MADPANTINDGGIKFVRQTITLKDTADANTVYIVRSGSMEAGVNRVTAPNENGVENKQALMATIPAGSLTLGFVNADDKVPKPMQFASVKDADGVARNILVGKVGQQFGAGEDASVTVDIYARQSTPEA